MARRADWTLQSTSRACVELDLNGGALYAGQPLTMSRVWVENLDKEAIGWGLDHETRQMRQAKGSEPKGSVP